MYIHTPKKILMHKSERSELSIFFNRESIAQNFCANLAFFTTYQVSQQVLDRILAKIANVTKSENTRESLFTF